MVLLRSFVLMGMIELKLLVILGVFGASGRREDECGCLNQCIKTWTSPAKSDWNSVTRVPGLSE